jgi:predicted transcriptional regulator
MIEMLKKIGLPDLEARCYLALLDEPDLSGYEVAKRVSVSRSNVYSALRSLSDKGACRMLNGEPVHYDAVPIEQLVKLLQTGFEQTTKLLLDNLKSVPRSVPAFLIGRAARRWIRPSAELLRMPKPPLSLTFGRKIWIGLRMRCLKRKAEGSKLLSSLLVNARLRLKMCSFISATRSGRKNQGNIRFFVILQSH